MAENMDGPQAIGNHVQSEFEKFCKDYYIQPDDYQRQFCVAIRTRRFDVMELLLDKDGVSDIFNRELRVPVQKDDVSMLD